MSGKRAKEGTCLGELVRLAMEPCRAAQASCPRTGPGRPPDFQDWQIAVLIIVAIAKKRKTKSGQYRYLSSRRDELIRWLSLPRWPSRGTYFDRYLRVQRILAKAIEIQGRMALAAGIGDARVVAVDKSLISARGPQWHRRDRQCQHVPPGLHGLDRQATWGRSPHDGWVYGYSYEVVITATKRRTFLPLLASADVASASEHRSFGPKIGCLPKQVRYVLADSGYDNNGYGREIEFNAKGRRTGRRFICPFQPRAHRATPGETSRRGDRGKQLRHRAQRHRFYSSPQGRRLFAWRGQSVEPFNAWLKQSFELEDRVWHRGLENNQTQFLAAIFTYQLLLRYNHQLGRRNGQIQWALDILD